MLLCTRNDVQRLDKWADVASPHHGSVPCYSLWLTFYKHIWVATLTFRVTWRHRSRDHSMGHGPFPIGVPLVLTLYLHSPKEFEIFRLKCIRFTVLTFLGHVDVISHVIIVSVVCGYRCSIDTNLLSGSRLWQLQCQLTSSVTWLFVCSWPMSYRCSICTDILSDLQGILRYWGSNVSGSLTHGLDHSRSRDVISHVIILSVVCGFI